MDDGRQRHELDQAYAGTITDKSGKGNTGTLTNMGRATSTVAGKIGQALKFNGTSSYIESPDSLSLDPTTITISAWIKVTGKPSTYYSPIVAKQNTNTNQGYWLDLSTNSKFIFMVGNASTYYSINNINATSLTSNKWYQVVTTYDGSIIKAYLNGALASTTPFADGMTVPTNRNLRIGTDMAGSNGTNFDGYFPGSIDDVRVYNRALSATEVQQLYNQSAATYDESNVLGTTNSLQNGLVGWWTFDGKNMTSNVADSSGKGNTGVLLGQATTTAAGKIGQALKLNGSSGYVSVKDSASFSSMTNVTVSAWFKLVTNSPTINSLNILSKASGKNGFQFQYSKYTKTLLFGAGNGTVTDIASSTVSNLNDGQWRLLTGTYDGTTIKFYVNGVLVDSNTQMSGNITNDTGNPLTIGGWVPATFDDFRVYNRALSATEIQQLYNQSAATYDESNVLGTTNSLQNGLVGWWTFDGKNMTSNVADSSGKGNTGVLLGQATTTAAGKIGQALKLNGSSGYVSVKDSASFSSMTNVTVSA